MAITENEIKTTVRADVEPYKKDMGEAARVTQDFKKEVEESGSGALGGMTGKIKDATAATVAGTEATALLGTTVAAAGAAAAAAAASYVVWTGLQVVAAVKIAETADANGKLAASLGLDVDAFDRMASAARANNSTVSELASGIQSLENRMQAAAAGAPAAVALFDSIGFSIRDASGNVKDGITAFREISDILGTYREGTAKTTLEQDLLGASAKSLHQTIAAGTQGMDEAAATARALGVVYSSDMAASAARLHDNMDTLRLAVEGLTVQFGKDMLPVLEAVTYQMAEQTKQSGLLKGVLAGIGEVFSPARTVFETIIVLGGNVVYVFKEIGVEIGGIAAQIAALSRGDFSAFQSIGKMMKEDAAAARKEIDAWSALMLDRTPVAPRGDDSAGAAGREAPVPPRPVGRGSGGRRSTVQDYDQQLLAKIRQEIDQTDVVKAQTLADTLAKLDKMAAAGLDPAIVQQVRDKLTGATAAQEAYAAAVRAALDPLYAQAESLARQNENYGKTEAQIQATTAARIREAAAIAAANGLAPDQLAFLEKEAQLRSEIATQLSIGRAKQLLDSPLEQAKRQRDANRGDLFTAADAGAISPEQLASGLQAAEQTYNQTVTEIVRKGQDTLFQGLLTEEEQIRQSYERRREDILNLTVENEAARQEALLRLEEDFAARKAALQAQRDHATLSAAGQLFGGLAGLAKAYAGKQSGIYRVLFATSKAFAIADAAVQLQNAIAKAWNAPPPLNFAQVGAVASATAGLVGQIASVNYAGAYDLGGSIPVGRVGMVGEAGPEFVRGPAQVTSRRDTARILERAAQAGQAQPAAAPQINQRVIVAFDQDHIRDALRGPEGENVWLVHARANPEAIRQIAAA